MVSSGQKTQHQALHSEVSPLQVRVVSLVLGAEVCLVSLLLQSCSDHQRQLLLPLHSHLALFLAALLNQDHYSKQGQQDCFLEVEADPQSLDKALVSQVCFKIRTRFSANQSPTQKMMQMKRKMETMKSNRTRLLSTLKSTKSSLRLV